MTPSLAASRRRWLSSRGPSITLATAKHPLGRSTPKSSS